MGAGVAGLSAAALIAKSGLRTVCIEKDAQAGGRLQSFDMEGGWRVDIGLHMTELGDASSCAEVAKSLGKEIEWAKFSETVEIFREGRWYTLQELITLASEEIEQIKNVMRTVAGMTDEDIQSNDHRCWEDWLKENVPSVVARELFSVNGMIMTTVPDPAEMSAGEILYIARDNLRKKRNFLTAAYPKGGMLGIINPIKDAFLEAGGDLILGTTVDSVLFEGNKVKGVAVQRKSLSPYPSWFYMPDRAIIEAPVVVLAIPLWNLDDVLDLNPYTSLLPEWWIKRYEELKFETTGLIGYTIALKEPVYDRANFLSALCLENTGLPFQAFVPSAFDPDVAPPGKSLMQTDCVVEVDQIFDRFELERLLSLMWKDIQEMFPGIDAKVEWKFPYKCIGCDGLARKPGQVGAFKPDVVAPAVEGLFFAGDTYRGRGLAMNSAALSGKICADEVLKRHGK